MIGDGKAKMTEVIRAAARDAGTLLTGEVAALAALALGVGLAALLLALRPRSKAVMAVKAADPGGHLA